MPQTVAAPTPLTAAGWACVCCVCALVQEEAKTLAQAQEQAQSLRAEITRLREERDQAQQVGHDAVCVAAALSCN